MLLQTNLLKTYFFFMTNMSFDYTACVYKIIRFSVHILVKVDMPTNYIGLILLNNLYKGVVKVRL